LAAADRAALGLLELMGATGWIDEARRAL